jgi:hypothetical protein
VRGTSGNRTFTNSTNMREKGRPWVDNMSVSRMLPTAGFSIGSALPIPGAGAKEIPSLGGEHVGFPNVTDHRLLHPSSSPHTGGPGAEEAPLSDQYPLEDEG